MEFHSWQTMLDEYKKVHKQDARLKHLSEGDLYHIELENIMAHRFSHRRHRWNRLIRLVTEKFWEGAGRPYYNVHPNIVGPLCKTNLDKIPANLIEMPGDLECVCFRFADDIPIKYTDNSGLAVVPGAIPKGKNQIYCRSVLFSRIQIDNSSEYVEMAPHMKDTNQFVIIVDEGMRFKDRGVDRTLCNLITFGAKPGQTIPEAIQQGIEESPDHAERATMLHMGERLANLFRVIITSGFLANSSDDGMIVPDVLARDRQAYAEAVRKGDKARIETIVSRARRQKKVGYNIGTNEMFVGESVDRRSSRGTGTGTELKYSHLRGGHFHAVRYGEGKKKVKIKWYRSDRVRPDLPFKSETH